ncbi:MAG: hypothetical protein ACFB4J_15015 [Elainellaceae cyanobacterium]
MSNQNAQPHHLKITERRDRQPAKPITNRPNHGKDMAVPCPTKTHNRNITESKEFFDVGI